MKPNIALTFLLAWLGLAGIGSAQIPVEIINVVPDAANDTVFDDDGDTPAYIELRNNNSTSSVDITGWHLTDDATNPTKWRIVGPPRPLGVPPARVIIPAGGTLRFFASGKNRVTEVGQLFVVVVYHTNFTYPCNVPYCQLSSETGGFRDSYSDPTDRCCEGVKVVGEGSVVRYHVPTQDIGGTWKDLGFVDREWSRGIFGLGYDPVSNPFCDDLILHFTMDAADVSLPLVRDVSDSPNVHDGDAPGASLASDGRIKEALSFSGEGGVRVERHPELDPEAGDFTVSLLVRPDSQPRLNVEHLIGKGAIDGGGGWRIIRNSDILRFELVSDDGTTFTSDNMQLFVGSWAHVAMVVEGGSKMRSYVRGVEDAIELGEASFRSARDLTLAADANLENQFRGDIDEVMIWNRALSPEEVIAIRETAGELRLSVKDPQAGYETGGLFTDCIRTDVEAEMRDVNSTLYVRAPFSLSQYPFGFDEMIMQVKYDDGFICYLNGAELVRRNAPAAGTWDSSAASDRPDSEGMVAEIIDLSAFVPLLRQGGNVLAFQALNSSRDAERFLIAPELCLGVDRDGGGQGEDCIKTTNGTDFWLAFPENFEEEPGAPLELRVVIAGDAGTTGTVELPGFPGAIGFPRNFTIPTSGIFELVIPKEVELAGAEEIADKGVHIVSSADVAVYGRNRMDFSTDAFLGLPTACLGTEYFVLGYNTVHDNEPLLHGTQFGIVAPYDDTLVTITPNENVGGKLAGVPFNVLLHRGQTYQLRNEAGQPADLTGTLVAADKPVGVFGSHRCANIASSTSFFCDFITEQLLPTKSWGQLFHVAPLRTRLGDSVRVISSEDDNLVTVTNSSGSTQFVLQRGEHRTFDLTEASRISSRGPLLVAQYSNSADADGVVLSDPFMVLIQPDPAWLELYRFSTPPTSDFGDSYITVVANSTFALSSVIVDTTTALLVPGVVTGSFSDGKVWATLPLDPGAHVVGGFSPELGGFFPIGLTVYGFDEFDSYAFPGGMQFNDNSPPIVICPPELTLECDVFDDAGNCFLDIPDFRQDPAVVFAFDVCDGLDVGITQNPPPGEPLGLGEYTIVFTATDSSGNSATCTMTLFVVEQWEQLVFSPLQLSDPSISGPFVDFDGDGVINILEEKGGTDPTDALDFPLFESSFDSDQQQRTFMRIRAARPVLSDPSVQCFLEGSYDLVNWRGGADIFEEVVPETIVLPGGQYEEVSFKALETVGMPVSLRYFVRWTVIQP